jgi:hypothetical protein
MGNVELLQNFILFFPHVTCLELLSVEMIIIIRPTKCNCLHSHVIHYGC